MKILLARLTPKLDENQSVEQAGFRSSFSTTDNLFVINQVIEKCNEFNINCHMAFIDYEKAFDSILHSSIWQALCEQGIEKKYIRILKEIYENSSASIRLEKNSENFKIGRGVKQGDPLSPKLFNAVVQHVFNQLSWSNKGFDVNDRKLSNLRFADDVVLFANTHQELIEMMTSLFQESEKIGLKANFGKTKIMRNTADQNYQVNGREIEIVDSYNYLGQLVSFQSKDDIEIEARISSAWRGFFSMRQIFKSDLALCLKRKIMDMCILPIFTYGSQCWALNRRLEEKLLVEQRAMERILLNISILDKIPNSTIRRRTKIKDVVEKIRELKWSYAGHVQRYDDSRWQKSIENWIPIGSGRSRGRPRTRWKDEIVKVASLFWRRKAQNRALWTRLSKDFIQQ